MYKREDFEIGGGSNGFYIRHKTEVFKNDIAEYGWYVTKNIKLETTEKYYTHELFYFISKKQAEEAITKFLAKQTSPVNLDEIENYNGTFENATKNPIIVSVTLNKGDKLTVERKPEKVFSLAKWITCWKNNPEYISQAILDGWVARCEGKTADEILKNESASIATDCFVYPEELNKEK